eukprot:SAG11_NODE_28153_length_325_cov_0.517699_1_plen_76_part_01
MPNSQVCEKRYTCLCICRISEVSITYDHGPAQGTPILISLRLKSLSGKTSQESSPTVPSAGEQSAEAAAVNHVKHI